MSTQRLEENYDWLKVVTTVMVVIGHAAIFFRHGEGVVPFEHQAVIAAVATFAYSFHMPLFMFLSGVIYSWCVAHGKYRQFLPFVRKKFRRLMIPYFFWGLLIVAPIVTAGHFVDQSYGKYVLTGILPCVDSRHLWYLWTLFALFLIVNLAQKIVRQKGPALALLMVLGMAGALLYAHLPMLLSIRRIAHFLLYFVLGMAFRGSPLPQWIRRHAVPVFVLCLAGNLCLLRLFAGPVRDLAAALLGIGFSCALSCFPALQGTHPGGDLLGKNTFGIYLAHPMLIYLMMDFYKKSGLYPALSPLFFVPAVVLVATLLSAGITVLLRSLHLGFALGE